MVAYWDRLREAHRHDDGSLTMVDGRIEGEARRPDAMVDGGLLGRIEGSSHARQWQPRAGER